jgi:hypothetical protein
VAEDTRIPLLEHEPSEMKDLYTLIREADRVVTF